MKIDDLRVLPVWYDVGLEVAAEILSRPGIEDPWVRHPGEVEADGILQLPLGGFYPSAVEKLPDYPVTTPPD